MVKLLDEIEWGTPVLPTVTIPEWESEVRAAMGTVPDILKRTSRCVWLRQSILTWPRYQVQECPTRLSDICSLVTAQENACRYCYGVARSQMRLFGYSEKMISSIEREMHLAELDEKERAFVQFCRNLSRSNPRPSQADRDTLIELGFSPLAVAELAFLIGSHCFVNRVSTFLAIPPMERLERLPTSLLGRALRPLIARKLRGLGWTETTPLEGDFESFPGVVQALAGLPAAKALNDALTGCFQPGVLSQELKVLMFAVVARSLECDFCQEETRDMARELGFSSEEFEEALQSLASPRLDESETKLLAWTRDTINFQPGPMQRRLKTLAQEVQEEALLEAMGVAALANSTVRLAVLLG